MSSQDKLLSESELREKLHRLLIATELHHKKYNELYDPLLNLINTQKRLYAESVKEELVDFAKDVLGQFGYSGKSGGLSTLEEAESLIKRYSKD